MADALSRRKMSSDWPILTKLRCGKLQRGCHHTQATCLATLRKVEGRSTFLATRNATIAVAKWGVTREFFLATCNATFVAMQVARKIASCNMAFKGRFTRCDFGVCDKLTTGLQLVYVCRVRKEKCRSILKHVLKRCEWYRRSVVSLSHAPKIVPCKSALI